MSIEGTPSGGVPPLPEGTWVMRIPVISSRHVDRVTMERLSGVNDFDLKVIAYPEGVFTSIPSCWTEDGDPDDVDPNEPDLGLPAELANCLRWAGAHGFYWVRLDWDGDIIDGLRVFDW